MESPWNRISVRARVIATMRATVAICVAKTSRSPSATPTMRPASTIVGKLRQGRNTARVSPPPFKVGAAQVSPEASGDTCAAPTLNGGGDRKAVFRPWRNFPTMVLAGLIVGVALRDRLGFATQIATVALIVAMTLALTERAE